MDEVRIPEKTPQQQEAINQLREPDNTPGWLLPLIFVLIGVFLVIFCAKTCNDTKPNSTVLPNSAAHVHNVDHNK